MPDKPFDLTEYIAILAKVGDSGHVLLTSAIVEEWLEVVLLTAMRDLSNHLAGKLFAGYGPLSSFAAKIDVAYAFNLIDTATYDDLGAIRAIRNAFAHTRDFLHFDSPEMLKHFKRFKRWKPDCDLKQLFGEQCRVCISALSTKKNQLIYAQAGIEK